MTKLSNGQKTVFAFLLALGALSLIGAVSIVPSGGGSSPGAGGFGISTNGGSGTNNVFVNSTLSAADGSGDFFDWSGGVTTKAVFNKGVKFAAFADPSAILITSAGELGWGPSAISTLDFNGNINLNANIVLGAGGGALFGGAGDITNENNLRNLGWITNGTGFTNGGTAQMNGTLLAKSNVLLVAGRSVSNTWVGGRYFANGGLFTNLNGTPTTFTNTAQPAIPANMLTNDQDMVRMYWTGVGADAMQNTQQLRIVYGSINALDSGLQIGSNYWYRAAMTVRRTGNTSQHVEAELEWGARLLGATGLPFAKTNTSFLAAQTNGILTVCTLSVAAQRIGALTNKTCDAWFDPAPR